MVGSVYGMNFEYLPLLHEPRGATVATAGMLLISLAMLAYFRRKHWI